MKKKYFGYAIASLAMLIVISAGIPSSAQIITTIAGNGIPGYTGDGGQATAAEIGFTNSVIVDLAGNIYFAVAPGIIRKVDPLGVISTIAGNGTIGHSGDGGPATNASITPYALAMDGSGNIYIAEYSNFCVRKIDTSGIISTFAGTPLSGGYSGDGGPATAAHMSYAVGVACDRTGNVYIVDDQDYRIRKVSGGIITTFAGNGSFLRAGDGGLATNAALSGSGGIAVDSIGNVYFVEDQIGVRKIDTSGIITNFAGNYLGGYSGDGGPATAAGMLGVSGLATDSHGNIYIDDANNYVVRIVNPSGIIANYAGNHTAGYSGDGGLATLAELSAIGGTAVDHLGNLYIADKYNYRVRKVSAPTAMPVITGASNGIWVYPNPVTNENFTCKITTDTNEEASITIANILGRQVFTTTCPTNTATNFSINAPPGIYFITATTKESKINKKLVIE